jgi:hypothetical protein
VQHTAAGTKREQIDQPGEKRRCAIEQLPRRINGH